ncbi:DUF2795 domain-containing protein [Streptomyces fradiae]|uniref:DUF2795 domain-containing protein n=1 Tax=Streptomyces fradiae TaxID=1906 RepID=UPI002943C38A|nr:DUF2795 domain-containing protein [Streptomyces fradiae]WOI60877.1 DUF2795 domain-containing protein [Streptomyces fradiae]WOI60939.1 DUF2795 domain-containing protein [Streptomyces fradiae]
MASDVNPIDVQKALKGADYPTSQKDLVALARQNEAGDDVVQALQKAGQDSYDGPDDVQRAIFDGT